MSLERRVEKLEDALPRDADGPTDTARLRHALAQAHVRRRLGLPAPPLPAGEGPLWERLRRAIARADADRARVQAGATGPWLSPRHQSTHK
jgi:hypothetical protein